MRLIWRAPQLNASLFDTASKFFGGVRERNVSSYATVSKREKIVAARKKLRERFLSKTSPSNQGSGPPNRHGKAKLPPGQSTSKKWPVLDIGTLPKVTKENFKLQLLGLCKPLVLSYQDLMDFEQVTQMSDFHCVTSWSKMDMRFRGVQLIDVIAAANIAAAGQEESSVASAQIFPDKHNSDLLSAMRTGGAESVIEFIAGFEDGVDRLNLYFLAQRTFGQGSWVDKNWDDYIKVVEAGMADALSQADAALDDELKNKRIDNANVMSYNLAADLAPCWPGDEPTR